MNEAKKRRIAEAEFTRRLKRMRETNALSIALLRTVSARSILLDEIATMNSSGYTFSDEHARAMERLEVNPAARLSAISTLFYTSLNVVVEGWRDPGQAHPRLSDGRIGILLNTGYPKALADFRNAMLHPNPLDDQRLDVTAAHPGFAAWANELCEEFVRYFRDWRRDLQGRAGGAERGS